MLTLLAILGLTGLALVAALAIPVDLEARASLGDGLRARLRGAWIFGLITWPGMLIWASDIERRLELKG